MNQLSEQRRIQLLALLVGGMSERMIADQMGISRNTVRRYRRIYHVAPGPRRRRYTNYRYEGTS